MDVEGVLEHAAHKELRPPVALLVYNPKDFDQASYLPFASFSPEWQALQYGLKHEVPVHAIDLPMDRLFGMREEANQLIFKEELTQEDRRMLTDPLGFLAELAGYADSERWWEATFEEGEKEEGVFEVILEMVRILRSELDRQETRETLLREAHMRKMIRKAVKEGFKNIAVVCGAWHAPVLADTLSRKASTDNKLLRGLNKVKTAVTWIPWTYDRLARQGGYTAGVVSPAWYALLFKQRPEVTIRWMSRVARLLRGENMDSSSAHVLEAVRLAETLAALRRRALPGLEELEEAAQSVFCQGDPTLMQLIRDKLIVGNKLGKVPPDIPVVPLQKDLEQSIRSARLTPESKTTELIRKSFDLRKETNRLASLLLHRLNILNIPWGRLRKGSQFKTGSFGEDWSLKWKPDFAIRIIEASAYGNTVYEASTNALLMQAKGEQSLGDLAALMEVALRADLREAVDPLILRMRDLAALTKDVYQLMEALPSMINILTYGDTRQTDTEAVEQLVDEIIPRICIGLPVAASNIEEEVAEDLFDRLLAIHHAVSLLDRSDHNARWLQALQAVGVRPGIHMLLRGAATRLLFDRGHLPEAQVRERLSYSLSSGNDTKDSAQWLEGFLHGSGLLLIHHPSLWSLIDDWVQQRTPEDFDALLPLLRRIFSHYLAAERRQMLQMASRGVAALEPQKASAALHQGRAARVLPTLRQLLGIGGDRN